MSFYEWRPYVSVAERRAKARRELGKLAKKGQTITPVTIEGRKIATSFWGESWCTNLERYSDYANRLPRGRSYVRNGSVVDLQIARGEVNAMVSGSRLYRVAITIGPVKKPHWQGICRDCAGSIDSLVELLQGKLAKSVMDRVCREGDGLFPTPKDITLSCSCPDWADMCKHVAAVLYGVGARLDAAPELLFVLRGVDQAELIATAGEDLSSKAKAPNNAQVLEDGDVAALFGLELADAGATDHSDTRPPAPKRKRAKAPTASNSAGAAPARRKLAGVESTARAPSREKPAGAATKTKALVSPRKQVAQQRWKLRATKRRVARRGLRTE